MQGKTEDLANVLSGWQPWMTPNGPQQAMNQGGMFLFEGDKVLFSYYDKVCGCGQPGGQGRAGSVYADGAALNNGAACLRYAEQAFHHSAFP
eukprot:111014-Chlamydomonas_euryale.AAC.1